MYHLECIWQPVFLLGLVTTENVVGNGGAEGWREQHGTLGEIFYLTPLLVCTFVCEVGRQNHWSQVSEITSAKDKKMSPEEERPFPIKWLYYHPLDQTDLGVSFIFGSAQF